MYPNKKICLRSGTKDGVTFIFEDVRSLTDWLEQARRQHNEKRFFGTNGVGKITGGQFLDMINTGMGRDRQCGVTITFEGPYNPYTIGRI